MLHGKKICIGFSCLAWARSEKFFSGKLFIGDNRGVEWQDLVPSHIENLQDLVFGKNIITGFKTFVLMEKFFAKSHFRIITRVPGQIIRELNDQIKSGRVSVSNSFENAVNFSQGDEVWVIGGSEIFKFAIPYADYVHRTMVKLETPIRGCALEKFFPDYDYYNPNEWKKTHPRPEIGWNAWCLHQGDKCETLYEIFERV